MAISRPSSTVTSPIKPPTGGPGIRVHALVSLLIWSMATDVAAAIVSATLPTSRSVQLNQTATLFATIINTGADTAIRCRPSAPNSFSGQFSFQTTNPATNQLTGSPNQAIDIAPSASKSFLLALTPTAEIDQTEVAISFSCASGETAPSYQGVNTLLLSASVEPTVDVIALAAASQGILELDAETGVGAFAVATANIGTAGTVTVSLTGTDLGTDAVMSICETSADGQCTNPLSGPTTRPFNTDMAAFETKTFSIFASSDQPISFNPADRRVFATFASEDGITRGSTSVAIRKLTSSNIGYKIVNATASGYQSPNVPLNVIDNDTSDTSRWSAEGRTNVWLQLDLGETRTINTLKLLFLDNNNRDTCFHIATSDDAIDWTTRRFNVSSDGDEWFSFPEIATRYVRYEGLGNTSNDWNSISDAQVWWRVLEDEEDTGNGVPGACDISESSQSDVIVGDQSTASGATFDPGSVSASHSPNQNFDLKNWKITYPDASEEDPPLVTLNEFYTDPTTGAMVFACPNRAGTTSNNTKYSRTELREMLRKSAGAKSLGNNWVISTASSSRQNEAGGVDGNMRATLAVDQVSKTTNTGEGYMLGRVIVGQIHASNDEPVKIYYRKRPEHTNGSVYIAYEDAKVELYFDLFGGKDTTTDPADGIPLGEKWAYEIDVVGRDMLVTVTKADGSSVTQAITWASEYDSDWFYFKAGNYNQNNGGAEGEQARVSFFALDVTHN